MDKKHILLAVTGSIAAYKAAYLLRLFKKAGMDVKVLMTPSAVDFISPLTFSVLSEHPVDIDISDGSTWNNHVDNGLWADVMVIAPCTANTMAGMAYGFANNAVLATYLSARCPVVVSPAMDVDMYHHPATQSNIERLKSHNVHLIPVEHGELASGLIGDGRMAEPETIFNYVNDILKKKAPTKRLSGKKVLITAGPTREPIDPVRYIGNRSSGKMGLALAEACEQLGAEVIMILGPALIDTNHLKAEVVSVSTAEEMYAAATKHFDAADIGIMAAAVADYTPSEVANKKLKKSGDEMQIPLKKTKDIAAKLGQMKRSDQLLIGFALETDNEISYASGKIEKKNLDFIVLNSLRDKGAGFAANTNKITIIHADGKKKSFDLKPKTEVAVDIVDEICSFIEK